MKLKDKRWTPILWLTIIFICFFMIDLLTKHFLFEPNKLGKVTYENVLFGIRSIKHPNSTLFSSLKWEWPDWARILFNLALAALVATIAFFTKSITQNIGLGIILAGIIGNSVDIIFTNGAFVKDIIFTPWADRGTFNFADMWMVLGAAIFLIGTIIKGFTTENK